MLSGFIIAERYRDALRRGLGYLRFLALRLGRLYPLHLAVLAAFLLRDAVVALAARAGWEGAVSHLGLDAALRALSYVGMVQGFPRLQSDGWNVPSWSISAEFYTYVVFAGLVVLGIRGLERVLLGCAVAGSAAFWLIVSPPGVDALDLYTEFGVLRSLTAFSLGAALSGMPLLRRWRPGAVDEVALIVGLTAFVLLAKPVVVIVAGPFLCVALVLVFAREAGPVARLLGTRPFRFLGPLSYSIYMTHYLLNQCLFDAIRLASRATGVPLEAIARFGEAPGTADALALAYLALLVGLSWTTHRWIEAPARAWTRRRAGRQAAAGAPAPFQAAGAAPGTRQKCDGIESDDVPATSRPPR